MAAAGRKICLTFLRRNPLLWQGQLTAVSAKRTCHQSSSLLLEKNDNGIKTITLNNSQKRNALSLSMLDAVKESLLRTSKDENIHVVILSASGPVFSSGHNLKELRAEAGTEEHTRIFRRCSEVMELVQDIPQPVIAQVRGLATAAGCQLAASCDLVVSSDNAKYATPGVFVGLFCSTPAVAVARALPRKVAMHMLLTGEPITAQEAFQHGLVNKIVPDESLEDETMKLAEKVSSYSRSTIALGKKCFYKQITRDRSSAYKIAEEAMIENLGHTDAQLGIDAFINKKHPTWTHKE